MQKAEILAFLPSLDRKDNIHLEIMEHMNQTNLSFIHVPKMKWDANAEELFCRSVVVRCFACWLDTAMSRDRNDPGVAGTAGKLRVNT